MTLDALDAALAQHRLTALGGFHPGPRDGLDGIGTMILVGPDPGFWPFFTDTPEYSDGAPDPLDRWSHRVISAIADGLGARAFFPFGGPPWHPFIAWAQRTGWATASPVTLLVHARAGLWVSYRGAIGVAQVLDLPEPPPAPCLTCQDRPCRTACPVDALASGYDTAACHGHLSTEAGVHCLSGGCAARAACPVSRAWGRAPEQSAFHMRAFHR